MQKPGKKIFIISIIISAVFLVCGMYFILFMGHLSKQETKKHVRQATDQTAYAVDNYILENFYSLSAAAEFLSGHDFLHDPQYLTRAKKAFKENNKFEAVGFGDLKGNTTWIGADNNLYHIIMENQKENFNKAISGKIVLSESEKSVSTDKYVNIYFMPIIFNSEITGVLLAADDEKNLRDIVNNSLYAGQGFAHIVNENGDYVVRSNDPNRDQDPQNVFGVQPPINPEVEKIIRQNMKERKSGELERAVYKENRLLAYVPLNINNWYLLYVVIEDNINAGLKTLMLGSIMVIVFAILLFIILNFLVYRINRSSRIKLEKTAYEDPLTGHRNMAKFITDTEKITRTFSNERFALIVCDVRRFQMINDLFGRAAGDFVIRQMSLYLTESMREHEIFGRAGGDIFLILRRHPESLDLDERIRRVSNTIIELTGRYLHGYRFDICCGIYIFCPKDEDLPISDMIDRANEARKKVKESGPGSGYAFYSEEMRERKRFETDIESAMESALDQNEFKVYFQPKIDIQSENTVMGMEALVRWESPEKGLIPPVKFISLFERNGFIVKLDFFVFNEACRFYHEHLLGKTITPLIMSVNASRMSILYPSFVQRYIEVKEKYGIPDGMIELEFTESIALGDLELFRHVLGALHENGFLCSLDDFGSGYSSLNFLMNLAVDVVKLDGQFFSSAVSDDRRENIVQSIVEMAKKLQIKTVAEGVDEEQHVHLLRSMGCSAIQGYYFSKPLNQDDFLKYLNEMGNNENLPEVSI